MAHICVSKVQRQICSQILQTTMFKVHRQGAIVAIAGILWLILSLEKAALIPFAVNDRFGDLYASKPPLEVAIYMSITQIGAASMYYHFKDEPFRNH